MVKLPSLKFLRRSNDETPNVSETASHSTVLDVGAEKLGKTYARALLAATQADGSTEVVVQDLNAVCDEALQHNPKLQMAFESPQISADEKCRVVDRLFGGNSHPALIKLMKVMAGRGRLGYLAAVRDAAVDLADEAAGRVVAEVRTAVPMSDQLRGEVTEQLSQRLGKSVRLRESVDADLIGGMIIRVGDTVFDSSVASRLDKLGKSAAAGFARQLMEQSDRFSSSA
ncbi:ATP synthase F1 subunit delta [Rhodopirellula halodulae]|uniref:ATP synthase F1 subunit delta n=1 Tax=Rhodopirellula halodulae TaxID=2894198 RepID=UPI003F687DFA